jgi:hypothetical protein
MLFAVELGEPKFSLCSMNCEILHTFILHLNKSSWSWNHKCWPCLIGREKCVDLAVTVAVMRRHQQWHCLIHFNAECNSGIQGVRPYLSLSSGRTIILFVNPHTDTCARIRSSSVVFLWYFPFPNHYKLACNTPNVILSSSFLLTNFVLRTKSESQELNCLYIHSQAFLRLLFRVAAHG